MTDTNLLLPMRTGEIRIHDAEGFEGMRKAGRLVAECLDMLVPEVKPGVTLRGSYSVVPSHDLRGAGASLADGTVLVPLGGRGNADEGVSSSTPRTTRWRRLPRRQPKVVARPQRKQRMGLRGQQARPPTRGTTLRLVAAWTMMR